MRSPDEAFAILMYAKKLTAQPMATPTNAEVQRPKNFNRVRTWHLFYTERLVSNLGVYHLSKWMECVSCSVLKSGHPVEVKFTPSPQSSIYGLAVIHQVEQSEDHFSSCGLSTIRTTLLLLAGSTPSAEMGQAHRIFE